MEDPSPLPGTRNISGDYCPTRVPAGGVKLNVPAETPGFF